MIAALYRRIGESKRADRLEKEAAELKERFNKDFWLDKQGFYALALQKGGEPCAVLSLTPARPCGREFATRKRPGDHPVAHVG